MRRTKIHFLGLLSLACFGAALEYDLRHLTAKSQDVCGPIQDDEALFIFALVQAMRLRNIAEIGGQTGYSARNFIAAMQKSSQPTMLYTIDLDPVQQVAPNHKVIQKDARLVLPADFNHAPLDLIFFDCHEYLVQMALYRRLVRHGIINNSTVILLHDTDVWYLDRPPSWCDLRHLGFNSTGPIIHQPAERRMVNTFKDAGYNVFNLHTRKEMLTADLVVRHGLTVCTLSQNLKM